MTTGANAGRGFSETRGLKRGDVASSDRRALECCDNEFANTLPGACTLFFPLSLPIGLASFHAHAIERFNFAICDLTIAI